MCVIIGQYLDGNKIINTLIMMIKLNIVKRKKQYISGINIQMILLEK